MKHKIIMTGMFLVGIATAVMANPVVSGNLDKDFADGIVANDGDIRVPDDFRQRYIMLGAWSVAGDADTGGEIGLHIVYTSPEVVSAYKQTGRFPDGAVFVKELFSGKTEDLTTGEATSAKDVAGYFVMIKDDKGRFPDNKLWGAGWGWAFFEAGDKSRTTSTDYTNDCLACHAPAEQTDYIYTQGYPILKD